MSKGKAGGEASIYHSAFLALAILIGVSLSIVSLVLTFNIPRHW